MILKHFFTIRALYFACFRVYIYIKVSGWLCRFLMSGGVQRVGVALMVSRCRAGVVPGSRSVGCQLSGVGGSSECHHTGGVAGVGRLPLLMSAACRDRCGVVVAGVFGGCRGLFGALRGALWLTC